MRFRTRIPWKTFGRCGLAQGIMEDVDLTEESNKSFFSFEESTSSMNPVAMSDEKAEAAIRGQDLAK